MTTGFLGARPTVDELIWGDEGADPALAHQLLTAPRRGWMWMLQTPEATLAEHLRGDDKHLAHHPYAAFVAACLHRGIAGWFPDPDQPGLRGIIVRPGLVPHIRQASVSHDSPHGRIRVAWRREAGCIIAEISTPLTVGIRLDLPSPALELPASATALPAARPGGTSWQLPGGEHRIVFHETSIQPSSC
jgi:alpha-L-rhamnosidase